MSCLGLENSRCRHNSASRRLAIALKPMVRFDKNSSSLEWKFSLQNRCVLELFDQPSGTRLHHVATTLDCNDIVTTSNSFESLRGDTSAQPSRGVPSSWLRLQLCGAAGWSAICAWILCLIDHQSLSPQPRWLLVLAGAFARPSAAAHRYRWPRVALGRPPEERTSGLQKTKK